MTARPVRGKTGEHTWTCGVCGRLFWWDDEPEAEWFGSWLAVDECDWDRIVVVCSAECKSKAKVKPGRDRRKRSYTTPPSEKPRAENWRDGYV